MTPAEIIALVRLLIWAGQTAKEAYDKLTPEQKAEIHQVYVAWQEHNKTMAMPSPTLEGP